jgi:hypothetical protein
VVGLFIRFPYHELGSLLEHGVGCWQAVRHHGGGPGTKKGKCEETSMMLMHAIYMHELCSLLLHIPTYYNVISFYKHVL